MNYIRLLRVGRVLQVYETKNSHRMDKSYATQTK